MAMVAAAGLLTWVVFRWDSDTGSDRGVGFVSVTVAFLVVDADSGQPIEGATVHLADREYDNNPIPPHVLDLKTGRDGKASVQLDLMFYQSRGIPSGRLQFYRVRYPQWEIRIAANDYQYMIGWFPTYEKCDRRFHDMDAPPPPIEVRLRRASRGPDSKSGAHQR
jgi:hypothetical protein